MLSSSKGNYIKMGRFNRKLAIVTGATGVIGSKIAETLLDHGMIVVGLAGSLEELEKLSPKFYGKKGKFYPRKVDLTKEHEIKAAFTVGPVDILVICGGVGFKKMFMDVPIEAWKHMELGLSMAAMEAIKNMKINNNEGHIVHIHNIDELAPIPSPFPSRYGPAKFTITDLTNQLRTEFSYSETVITITSISSGIVEANCSRNPVHVADVLIEEISKPRQVAEVLKIMKEL